MTDITLTQLEVIRQDAPSVSMQDLDTVWFQVGGTVCNLRCRHCFISCSPENDKFAFMSVVECRRHLSEAIELGAKEFYFTGGEPFANPDLCDILKTTLAHGPATVLTNATLFRQRVLDRLKQIDQDSAYSLELRVSLDGYTAEMNDPVRGDGSFDQAMDGVRRLVAHEFMPIMTITRTWSGDDDEVLAGFVRLLEQNGYERPRLKILPLLQMGAELTRGGGYGDDSRVTSEMMAGYDQGRLLCSGARLVTDQGVWVCPILLDSPGARMGETLRETMRDFPLGHPACYTCWAHGAICSNISS